MPDDGNSGTGRDTDLLTLRDRVAALETLGRHHRAALKALSEKEASWRSLVENAQDIIFTVDRQEKITFINRVVPGLTVEEVLGTSMYDYIPSEHHGVCRAAIDGVFRTGEPADYETAGDGPHGSRVWYATRVGPVLQDGEVTAVTLVSTDITARKKAEEELKRAKEETEAVNRELQHSIEHANRLAREAELGSTAKSELLADVSHEIRSPMNTVVSMLDLLLKTPLATDQRRFAGLARSSADSLLELINDLLDLSASESGKMPIASSDFDLRVALDELCDALSIEARQKGLELVGTVESDVPSAVRGDPGRLRQVIINVVGNAIKYTERGSVTVRVSADRQDSGSVTVRFTVTDTGIGIPEDRRNAIFDKYIRIGASASKRNGSTGLGLSISRQLVEGMGGQIGADSEVEEGSRFWFTVVLEKQPAAETPRGVPAREICAGEGREPLSIPENRRGEFRILLAEDAAGNRESTILLLEASGYRVDGVESGGEALEALASRPYDLLLLDLQMPDMSGLQVARAIRDPNSPVRDPDLPIIAVTGRAAESDREHCLEAGMNDYLPKPYDAERLTATIDRHLAGETVRRNATAVAAADSDAG
jgi:PAS domain S-box-containing protein